MSRKRNADTITTGIGLDDAPDSGADDTALAVRGRPRQDQRPVCPKHGQQMVAYSTNAMHTFYRCPVEGCAERAKRVRPVGPFKDLYGNGKSGAKK